MDCHNPVKKKIRLDPLAHLQKCKFKINVCNWQLKAIRLEISLYISVYSPVALRVALFPQNSVMVNISHKYKYIMGNNKKYSYKKFQCHCIVG